MERSQGHIRTANKSLAAALPSGASSLRASPTADMEPVRRVYVESPLSADHDDDQQYQFVDTHLDDLERSYDNMPGTAKMAAGSGRYEDPIEERYSDRAATTGRYSDRDGRFEDEPVHQEKQPEDTRPQYLVRSKPGSQRSTPHAVIQPISSHTPHAVVQPIGSQRSTPHALVQPISSLAEEEAERQALQREAEYQRALQEKLWEQTEIPPLALDKLDEGPPPGPPPGASALYDSLEDEYLDGDSLEERQQRQVEHQLLEQQRHQQQLLEEQAWREAQEGYYTATPPQSQPQAQPQTQPHHQHQPHTQPGHMVQDSLEYPLDYINNYPGGGPPPPGPVTHGYVPQHPPPHSHGGGPGSHGYQHQAPRDHYQNHPHQHPQHVYQAPPTNHQHVYQAPPTNSQHVYQAPPSHQAPPAVNQAPPGVVPGPPASHQAPPSPSQPPPAAVAARPPPAPKTSRPKTDFLERNKKKLKDKEANKKSYGQLFTNKQASKENKEPVRSPKAPHKPAPAKQDPGRPAEPVMVHGGEPDGGAAENLWATRSQKLHHRASGGSQRASSQRPGLRKFPSESGVDGLGRRGGGPKAARSGPAGQRAAPDTHQRFPAPRQSVAEPIRSEVTPVPGSPSHPITHTIVTEDGQRLSVDINLKVISPKGPVVPGQGPHQPVSDPGRPPLGTFQQNPAAFRPHQGPAPTHSQVQTHELPSYDPYNQTQYEQDPYNHGQYPNNHAQYHPDPNNHGQYHPDPNNHGQYHPDPNNHGQYHPDPNNHGQYHPDPNNHGQYHPDPNNHRQYSNNGGPYQTTQGPHQTTQGPYQTTQGPYATTQGPYPGQPADQYPSDPHSQTHTGGYISPDDRRSQTPLASPYRVLPPIGSADTDQGGRRGGPSPRGRGTDPPGPGYASQYAAASQKTQRGPEYKQYTLEDYRRLKKEVRLGGLGPELDSHELREKREKRQRQLEYARAVKNRTVPSNSTGGARSSPQRGRGAYEDTGDAEDDMASRRRAALEYAKSVPKPKVAPKKPGPPDQRLASSSSLASHPQTGGTTQRRDPVSKAPPPQRAGSPDVEVIDVNALWERHEQERRQAALIRQNVA